MARGGFRPGAGRPKGSKGRTAKVIENVNNCSQIPTPTRPGKTMSPLQFMLEVLNDETEDPDMRARMAIAAAPYVHPKAGEGKKQDRADRAKKAGAGKFSQGKPPFKVVK